MPSQDQSTQTPSEPITTGGDPGSSGPSHVNEGEAGTSSSHAPIVSEAKIVDEITALREVVLAAAKHFKIDLGPAAQQPSQVETEINLECLKPTDDSYDEEETIRRHKMFLPTSSVFSPRIWDVRLDGLDSPASIVKLCQPTWPPLGEGLLPVVQWSLSTTMSKLVVEYGYDADGAIRTLGTLWPGPLSIFARRSRMRRGNDMTLEFQEHTLKSVRSSKSGDPKLKPPWAGQRFGKEWIFPLHSQSDPLSLSVAVCQLLEVEGPNGPIDTPDMWLSQMDARNFVRFFAGDWFRGLYFDRWMLDDARSDLSCILQFHLRFLRTSHRHVNQVLGLKRKFGRIHQANRKYWLFVREARISVAVRTTCDLDLPVFSMVVVSDMGDHGANVPWEILQFLHPHPDGIRTAAISAFRFRLGSIVQLWDGAWTDTLREFDSQINAEVDDILSREKRRKLMYDDSDLTVSELYFFILQLLRIAADWIRGSVDDLQSLRRCIPIGRFLLNLPDAKRAAATELFNKNWDALCLEQKQCADKLLSRIARKEEEVNGLREALFTATAVSEATKSKQLNHYILVFTVVTIFYLPLSFVAALYALDLFSWDDPNQTTSFAVTLVLVAGTTYAFAGVLVWSVREPRKRRISARAKRVKENFMRRFGKRRADGGTSETEEEGSDKESV